MVIQSVGCQALLGIGKCSTGLGLRELTAHCGGGQNSTAVTWNGVNYNRDTVGHVPAGGDQRPFQEGCTLVPGSVLDRVHRQKRVLALLRSPEWGLAGLSFWCSNDFLLTCQHQLPVGPLFPAVSSEGYLRHLCPRCSKHPVLLNNTCESLQFYGCFG